MGTQLPSLNWHSPHNFRLMPVVAKWLDGLRCHLLLKYASTQATRWRPRSPPEKKYSPTQIRPISIVVKRLDGSKCHSYGGKCRSKRRCIRWGLPLKGAQPHAVFGTCLLGPNGWMDEDATCYGSRPRPRRHCVRQGPIFPCAIGAQRPPLFGPCLLWARAHVSYC